MYSVPVNHFFLAELVLVAACRVPAKLGCYLSFSFSCAVLMKSWVILDVIIGDPILAAPGTRRHVSCPRASGPLLHIDPHNV